MASEGPSPRAILRIVLIVVLAVVAVYLLYLLRRPISWLVIAAFIAVAMSGPVNLFERKMKRGLAIALSYTLLIAIPIGLGAALVPNIVDEIEVLATNVPGYANDVTEFVNENETLRDVNNRYDITSEIESAASELPNRIGDAAGILRDIGVGLVNSIFAGVTILILSIFMVGGGRRWIGRFLATQPEERSERIGRAVERVGNAIGNYVGGVLLQATIAAVTAFVVLELLGSPFAGPLALVVFFFDLIPVVGATIGAVLVGITLIFVNFPLAVIVWTVYAIVYQQIENYVIQPQIQRRATKIEPFVILVAVLFGSSLFGVVGAILAIPAAASIQIAIGELLDYRRESQAARAKPGDAAAEGHHA